MDDRVGTTLGHYRIKGKLGKGGMGEVYLAEDTKLNRDVALKVLPTEVAGDPERLQRFEREAKAVAGLNHPNIVTLHSIEETDGTRYITMERVSGETLSAVVPETGLKLPRFFKLAIALADALSAAHAQGITHRDLKPENVMVDDDGRLKILDFGLAKLAPVSSDSTEESDLKTASVTQDGRILGTVSYMSPEQAQGKAIDHRSDIFSLGILLYEMATGARPFKGDNNMSVLSGILKDEPAPVTEIRGELPRPLARMIQRTLEKNVKNRYQSTSDLRKDLEDLQRDVETGEISATGLSSPGFSAGVARPAWLWAAAVVGSVLLAGAIWFTRATHAPPPPTEVVAAEDDRPSLAIFYFDNLTGDPSLDWLRTGLTDMLVTDLTQSPDLRVLGTARLYQILDEMGRLDGQTTSFEVVKAVAQKARVTNALVGSFVKAGETIRISARLQDATSGEVIASERVEGQGEDSILSLVDALTQRIRSRYEIGGPVSRNLDRDLKDVTTSSLKAYKAYVEGVRLHEELREQEAIPHLEQAVELDPDFAMAWAKLSVSSGNLGKKDEAREYAKRALDLIDHLSPRERYYIEGRYYSLDPREGERAIAAYEKAVTEYDHTSARNNLAQAYIELRRYPEAIVHLEYLRERGMTFPGTYSALSQAYVATGDFEKGYEILKEFTEANRTMAAGWSNLAKLLLAWGRYDDARDALATLEELDSESGNAATLRWQLALLEDDWSTAEQMAARLADAQHPSMRWMMYAGKAVREGYRGQTEAALRELSSARKDPELPSWALPQTAFIESNILIQSGDYAGARAAAKSVSELTEDPFNRGFARQIEAVALALEGRQEEADAAFAEFEAFIETMPKESMGAELSASRGLFRYASGDADEAVVALEGAHAQLPRGELETKGTAADIWYYLGRIEFERDNHEAARAWFGRVTGAGHRRLLQPFEYVRSLDYLGRIAEARGDTAAASRYYGRFLDYWGDGDVDRDRVAAVRDWLATHSGGSGS